MLQVEQIHARACALEAMADTKEPLTVMLRREFDEWLTSDLPKAAPVSERARQMQALIG